ncbi:hypothetical protein GQ472_02240 [archaeon]|nr:hypothetical protein [archaeon]
MISSSDIDAINIDKMLSNNKKRNALLDENGYSLHYPFGKWNVFTSSLEINYTENDQKIIEDNNLIKILDGSLKVSEKDCKIIREWYSLSAYRCTHEAHKIDKKIDEADKKGQFGEVEMLKNISKNLISELIDYPKERKKKQLAHKYNESSKERINELYNILNNTPVEKTRMGSVIIETTESEVKAEIEKSAYIKSNGFFEDISNAYDVIKNIRGYIKDIPGENLYYTDLRITAESKTDLTINSKNISLTADIIRDDFKDYFFVSIFAKPINYEIPELLKRLETEIPSCGIISQEKEKSIKLSYKDSIIVFAPDYEKLKNQMIFFGEPDTLKQAIPEVLSAIL